MFASKHTPHNGVQLYTRHTDTPFNFPISFKCSMQILLCTLAGSHVCACVSVCGSCTNKIESKVIENEMES